MNQSEKITATVKGDGAGNVVVPSKNNTQYGYIRVEQIRMDFEEETGFLKEKVVSALIPGELTTLRKLGWSEDQEVEGKVYIREQLKPFNTKDPEKDIKMAGETGVVCTLKGEPIYRKSFFTKNVNTEDVRLAHDNTDEIKVAYATIQAEKELAKSNVANPSTVGSM